MEKINNKGFSYVEMIIVLAIMAIMVGFVSISLTTSSRNEVNRTSEKLESLVNTARTTAMTKGSDRGVLNIVYTNNAYYAYIGNEVSDVDYIKSNGEKICSDNVQITLVGVIDAASPYRCLSFKQDTGGLRDRYRGANGLYHTAGIDMHIMVSKGLKSKEFAIDRVTGKTY